VATTTTRLALRKPDGTPVTGDTINVSLDINGSMDKIDAAVGFTVCTSGTRPTTGAWQGMPIFETDTGRGYIASTGGPAPNWVQIPVGSSTFLANLAFRTGAETQDRFRIDAATGQLNWGSGSATADVALSRTAADTMSFASGDMLKVGGDFICGSEDGINGAAMASGTENLTSATYVDWGATGATTPLKTLTGFVKRFTSTRVRIDVAMTWYADSGDGPKVGVSLNGSDYDIFRNPGLTPAGARFGMSGFRYISSIPAGTYNIVGRWLRTGGSATIHRDSNDWVSLSARETN